MSSPITTQQRALALRQTSPRTGLDAPGYQITVLVQALTSPIAGIAILTVLLLLTLRIVKKRRLHGTDYALLVALVLDCGIWTESLLYVQGAIDNWLTTSLTPNDLVRLLKIIYAWMINYHLAKLATEVAILYMLKDTFKLEKRGFKKAWLATLALTVMCGVAAVIVDIARCTPVEKNWDFTAPGGKCLDGQAVIIGTNAAVGTSSVVILLLSFLQIIRDGVNWKVKALMLLYWIIGFLTVILCLPSVILNLTTGVGSHTFASDIPTVFIISVWEVSVGIMWAALPGIVQAFRKPVADGDECSPPTERRWYGRKAQAQTST